MHPALSVILFTVASGSGYGLLFLLGTLGPMGLLPPARGFGLAAFALALGLVTTGLVASTFHLGHPERAWRALSQWRSSWLSREGVSAALTYLPAGFYALGWVGLGRTGGAWTLAGFLTAAGAAATVACTAMIYASLRTVPRWHSPWTLPNYLALSLMSGLLWLAALHRLSGLAAGPLALAALAGVTAACLLRVLSWRELDRAPPRATIGAATGLGGLGPVRLLDAPHTEENYLLREMGFRVARKHAAKLRRVAVVAAFALPFALTLASLLAPPALAASLAALAALSALFGLLVERWLFFAEAKHTVTLFYGAPAV